MKLPLEWKRLLYTPPTFVCFYHEFDRSHSIVEKTSGLGTCWYCAVRKYQYELSLPSESKKLSDDAEKRYTRVFPSKKEERLFRFIDHALVIPEPMFWSEIVGGRRVPVSTGTRQCYYNEPLRNHAVLPDFMALHPRSTRRFYSLYKHDQSKRKARTGTIYRPTVQTYWYLDTKEYTYVEEAAYNTKHETADVREENPYGKDAICAVITAGGYSTTPVVCAESDRTQIVRGQWRKRTINTDGPCAPFSTCDTHCTCEGKTSDKPAPAPKPEPEPEKKPRRLSGNLSRAEMKRVLLSEEGLREISAHVAKMLHVYSIQEQGGEQGKVPSNPLTWNKKSKWSKREMDDMVMSFVVGRPRSTDANGNQQQPSGLYALISKIELDGRRRNVTPTFQETEPFRHEGDAVSLIRKAAKWIAESCKERELWDSYRHIQMRPADQNAGITEEAEREIAEADAEAAEIELELELEAERRDLDRLYMSKRDEETAAMDQDFADELEAAWLSDDEPVGVPTDEESEAILRGYAYDYAVKNGPDMRPISVRKESDWELTRSGKLRYIGPPLVNVPWWER